MFGTFGIVSSSHRGVCFLHLGRRLMLSENKVETKDNENLTSRTNKLSKRRHIDSIVRQISKNIREVYHKDESFILVELETERFHLLNLQLDARAVRKAILAANLKIKLQVPAGYLLACLLCGLVA